MLNPAIRAILLSLPTLLLPLACAHPNAGGESHAGETPARGRPRNVIGDYVEVEGARANMLTGYGIVTGLNGRGDSASDELARVLRNLIQNLNKDESQAHGASSRSSALVLVNAELPPFQKSGTRIGIHVSALGDATSLNGGYLQATALRGPRGLQDPNVYALASGPLVAEPKHPTVAWNPEGAITERELEHRFVLEDFRFWDGDWKERSGKAIRLLLRAPDIATAIGLADTINRLADSWKDEKGVNTVLSKLAWPIDGGSILVRIPTRRESGDDFESEPLRWLDRVLHLVFTPSR